MRITKDLTLKIVETLVNPITEKITETKDLVSKIVTDYILGNCPQEVFNLWNNKSPYIETKSYVTVNYLGQWNEVRFKIPVPYYTRNITIKDVDIANKLQIAYNDINELRKKKTELSKQLEVTILKLSTFARIREQFPEAAELLPDENKRTEIALNIEDVRNKLKNIP